MSAALETAIVALGILGALALCTVVYVVRKLAPRPRQSGQPRNGTGSQPAARQAGGS